MNKVILTGRLVRDWAIREITSGNIAKNTMAVDKVFKGEKTTTFVDLVLFNDKRIETVTKYTAKGSKLLVEGELQINSYQTKCKSCQTERSTRETSVLVRQFEFLDARDKDFNDVGVTDNSNKAWTKEKPKATIDEDIFSNVSSVEIGEDELPF